MDAQLRAVTAQIDGRSPTLGILTRGASTEVAVGIHVTRRPESAVDRVKHALQTLGLVGVALTLLSTASDPLLQGSCKIVQSLGDVFEALVPRSIPTIILIETSLNAFSNGMAASEEVTKTEVMGGVRETAELRH